MLIYYHFCCDEFFLMIYQGLKSLGDYHQTGCCDLLFSDSLALPENVCFSSNLAWLI